MKEMTPDEARGELSSSLHTRTPEYILDCAERALQKIASMHEEEDHGPIPFEKVDGRYENYHRVRYFTDWRDK